MRQFSIIAVVVVLLVIGQVPDSEQFEWSWTSFRNRISDTFRSSTATTTTRPSFTTTRSPRTRATSWGTTSAYYPTRTPTYVTTRRSQIQDQTRASSAPRTCACGEETASVCASNGVTYKNRCKFDCAKARVTRLRIVSNRACGDNMNRNEFWGSGRRN